MQNWGARIIFVAVLGFLTQLVFAQTVSAPVDDAAAAARRQVYAHFALEHEGDAGHGWQVFTNVQTAGCIRCHTTDGSSARVAPDLYAIGDKYTRRELIQAILEPSASIAVGYDTTVVQTHADEEFEGVIKQATDAWIELMSWDGKVSRIALADIATRRTSNKSFMPQGLEATLSQQDFADVVSYLQTLHQPTNDLTAGLAIPLAAHPVALSPFFSPAVHLEHPLWFGEVPGQTNRFVVEEQGGKAWLIEHSASGDNQSLLVNLSGTVFEGPATGLLGFAFHPHFTENRRYYLKYQIQESNHIYTVVSERHFAANFTGDSGAPAREIIRIPGATPDHNGGCIEFGPDGCLYIGMGDTGPQQDPQGHGQNLNVLQGKILRIDVDHPPADRPYSIPTDNPFLNKPDTRPEIWAYGFREPWRFTFDSDNGDLWVGDVGQDAFEEVSLVKKGENQGWNVFEGGVPFSNQYRRPGEHYVPPIFYYPHRVGVCVTGGYVYRGARAPAMVGHYVFGDYQMRHLWALTETNRQLVSLVDIGLAPSRISSFGVDHHGEIYLAGYDNGIIYHVDLSAVDPTPLEVRPLAETSEQAPVRWHYTLQPPATNWMESGFDAAGWSYGPGGFGSRNTPGAVVRTDWRTADIWLRREFDIAAGASLTTAHSIVLRVHHDEDAEIYLNGVLAAQLPRRTTAYIEVPLAPAAVQALHPGRNELAIHCHQFSGGQYIDAGLVEYVRGKP